MQGRACEAIQHLHSEGETNTSRIVVSCGKRLKTYIIRNAQMKVMKTRQLAQPSSPMPIVGVGEVVWPVDDCCLEANRKKRGLQSLATVSSRGIPLIEGLKRDAFFSCFCHVLAALCGFSVLCWQCVSLIPRRCVLCVF